MMGKNLNYAYPRKFAEGGDVQGYLREGIQLVEHNGKMVPADAVAALKAAVGLSGADDSPEVLRYDVNGDGRTTAHDAVQFLKYAQQEGYDDNAAFFQNFYGTPTFSETPSATPTPQTTPVIPPTATMPSLNLGMGNVAGVFTDNPPSPTAGQDAYQQFTVGANPQIASLYTPPQQQGLGSLMDNPLVQQSNQSLTNPYLQSSAPTQSVFQRPPGG